MIFKIKRNTILNYLPNKFKIEDEINPSRIFKLNDTKPKAGLVVYLIEREMRAEDNFALNFAIKKATCLASPLKIILRTKIYDYKTKNDFINNEILKVQKDFEKMNLETEIFQNDDKMLLKYLTEINASILIVDFNPVLNRNYLDNSQFKIYEIDGHNIIPARFVSDKQEYSAATFRRKFYNNVALFLTEYQNSFFKKRNPKILETFIDEKLPLYEEFRNNPNKNVQSNLSKYLNLGFISSQRVALEILKSNASAQNKETFLEELLIRKELADNFCLYCKNFKTLNCVSNWAKTTLSLHKADFKKYIYKKDEFENAKTHDELWNATQMQLIKEGTIFGYLRMYWAKKILQWSKNPQTALKIAIYLNDKYAYDAPSPSGYTGILWSIGGLHDRAFQEKNIIGKIRDMTYNGAKSKFNVDDYIDKFR